MRLQRPERTTSRYNVDEIRRGGIRTTWKAANHTEAIMRCYRCGTAGFGQDGLCLRCDTPLVRSCICCGYASRHPVAFYCTQCGAPLPEADVIADVSVRTT